MESGLGMGLRGREWGQQLGSHFHRLVTHSGSLIMVASVGKCVEQGVKRPIGR